MYGVETCVFLGSPQWYLTSTIVDPDLFVKLPASLKRPTPVRAVMFSQGINEMQVLRATL